MYSNFISSLNNTIIKQRVLFYYKFSNKIVKFLCLMVKEGLIQDYKILKNNLIKIRLVRRDNKFLIKKIKPVFNKKYISYKKIPINLNLILIISTNYGLMLNIQAKKLKIGGKVICKIIC